MEYAEIESFITRLQSISKEANEKRADFKGRGMLDLEEQALGEAVGVGKCLQLFIDDYPDEVNQITAPPA